MASPSFVTLQCPRRGGGGRGRAAFPSRPPTALPLLPPRVRCTGLPPATRQCCQVIARAVLTAANPTRQQQRLEDAAPPRSNPHYLTRKKDVHVGEEENRQQQKNRVLEPVSSEKLVDEWMRESIVEIVRNIGEAPFLLYVFFSDKGAGSAPLTSSEVRLERENAEDAETWPHIVRRWRRGSCPHPDAVILVEELRDQEGRQGEVVAAAAGEEEEEEEEETPSCSAADAGVSSNNKKWGLVVQGRGLDRVAACYILNTCRVRSPFGFCTHFCLAKAKCFGDTAEMQLKKAWLVGRD